IDNWSVDRAQIEEMFVTKPVNFSLQDEVQQCADKIVDALERIVNPNKKFIETITVELLTRIRDRDPLKRSKRKAQRTISAKLTGPPKRAAKKRKSRSDRVRSQ